MGDCNHAPLRARRGSGILGLLIVVVILLILTWVYLAPDSKTHITTAQTHIEKTRDAVCDYNIKTMESQMTMLQTSDSSAPITTATLERKGYLLKCPGGGSYVIKNGKIYCAKHSPPPQ